MSQGPNIFEPYYSCQNIQGPNVSEPSEGPLQFDRLIPVLLAFLCIVSNSSVENRIVQSEITNQ